MRPTDTTVRVEDVRSALQQYHHSAALEQLRARDWLAVVERHAAGTTPAAAIRQLLDQALAVLASHHPAAAELLRERFVHSRALPATTSALERRTQHAIDALAATIAELNHNTPRPASRFALDRPVVELERRAEQLQALLADPDAPAIVVVEGLDGRGKTTLARLIAARCGEAFAGVLWVSTQPARSQSWAGQPGCEQAAALNLDDLLLKLAQELAIEGPGDLASIRAEVHAHCARRRYLIVIDDLQGHADLAALQPLIDTLAGPSRLLLTVRDAPSPPALACRSVTLEELDAATSYRLLRRAAASLDAPELARVSAASLARLYALVGGNPLALWLVAGQARDRPLQLLLDELHVGHEQGRELYDNLYRVVWGRLSDDARTVLFAMHRCETGAERELLFSLSMLDQPAFEAALDELQRRMLLSFDGRYTIHHLTYTFLRAVVAGW